jgi:hypothetical protein
MAGGNLSFIKALSVWRLNSALKGVSPDAWLRHRTGWPLSLHSLGRHDRATARLTRQGFRSEGETCSKVHATAVPYV